MAKSNFKGWKGSMKKVEARANVAVEAALDSQAELLTKLSKREAPKDTGEMRSSVKTDKGVTTRTVRQRRVSYNTPYAAYQHQGRRADGSRVVKRYTTAGTKKLYLKDPLDKNTGKWVSLMVKAFKSSGF